MKDQVLNSTIDNFQGALASLFGESKAVASANVLIDAAQAGVGLIKMERVETTKSDALDKGTLLIELADFQID